MVKTRFLIFLALVLVSGVPAAYGALVENAHSRGGSVAEELLEIKQLRRQVQKTYGAVSKLIQQHLKIGHKLLKVSGQEEKRLLTEACTVTSRLRDEVVTLSGIVTKFEILNKRFPHLTSEVHHLREFEDSASNYLSSGLCKDSVKK